MSWGFFQPLLQWENRTGNTPPIGSFLRRAFGYRIVPVSSGKKRPSPCPWPCGMSGGGGARSATAGAEAAAFCPPQGHRLPAEAGRGGTGCQRP